MIVNRLDELMLERGVGYIKVAKATGLSINTLFTTRKGTSFPGEQTLDALCRYFGVQPGDLLYWQPDSRPLPKPSADRRLRSRPPRPAPRIMRPEDRPDAPQR